MCSQASLLAVYATSAAAASLSSVCTESYPKAALPADANPGVTIDPTSLTASASYNVSVTSEMFPDAVIDYCNVTFAYSHAGRNDSVLVTYWLPAPEKYQNRFLATGGGGLAINSGSLSVSGGIPYGAAADLTDGGFGGFDNQWDSVFLLANNTINLEAVYMFGYQAIHEMTMTGKAFTNNFFTSNSTKLYTYYQGYYPPPCELDKIVNATIAACDPLDGKTDGVVSRTDLCELHFNLNSTIGLPYSCAASTGNPMMGLTSSPAQNGTVTAQGAAVAAEILNGLQDSKGRQVYGPYQYASAFVDASTAYNSTTGKFGLSQSSLGGEWVERFLLLQGANSLPSLANVTYDTLKEWMIFGLHKYADSLQTTCPDLTPWHETGNKILHYHGESDNSIPTASSVRYHDSVRKIMYPHLSYNASIAALNKWYKFFSVPGAAHCSPNTLQPNGPFPQKNLQVIIDWVEKGIAPKTLNAMVLQGEHVGENRQICSWPLRPLWNSNGTQECVFDKKSLDTWHYELDAIKLPVY